MPEQGFPKSNRLPNAAAFSPVFNQPDFRVSCPQLLVLARVAEQTQPRLGVVVGRKHVPRAVRRNRVKRLVRETFRNRKSGLAGLDIVVLARKGVDGLDNAALLVQLQALFNELSRKQAKALEARGPESRSLETKR